MADTRTNTAVWQESRKRWRIVVKRDGVRKEFTCSRPGRAGQREANAKADKWLAGEMVTERIRVRDAVERYKHHRADIECQKRGIEKKPGTPLNSRMLGSARSDISALETWLVPVCGKKYIDKLTDGDVQDVLDRAAAAGRSAKTVRNIRGAITAMLKYYRRHGLTTYRPDDVSLPSYTRTKQKTILQPADLRVLMTSEKTELWHRETYDDYVHAYRLQVLTGLRPGEVIGLEWEDIDLENNVMHIRRSVNIYGETTSGKNENAIRDIRLHQLARKELLEQRIRSGWSTGAIFPIYTEHAYRDRLRRYCRVNGITEVTPYELRHTFVSMCQSLPEGDLKAIVGHSASMDTWGTYAHAVEGHDIEVSERIGEIFRNVL